VFQIFTCGIPKFQLIDVIFLLHVHFHNDDVVAKNEGVKKNNILCMRNSKQNDES
jgi:hypothetical protein